MKAITVKTIETAAHPETKKSFLEFICFNQRCCKSSKNNVTSKGQAK